MANLHYFKDEVKIDNSDKFLTVGELINILSELNPKTKVFLRNLDEWGQKPYIKNLDSYWEVSDGLITDVKKTNINQITGEEEYIILQGMINKQGFNTLDYEPYEETVYHHTWLDKMLNRVIPITSIKQLRNMQVKVGHECEKCKSEFIHIINDKSCKLFQINTWIYFCI